MNFIWPKKKILLKMKHYLLSVMCCRSCVIGGFTTQLPLQVYFRPVGNTAKVTFFINHITSPWSVRLFHMTN